MQINTHNRHHNSSNYDDKEMIHCSSTDIIFIITIVIILIRIKTDNEHAL